MSFPITNPRGLLTYDHSLDCNKLLIRTIAGLTFGTSIPTARLPGIGASIRILVAAKSSDRLFSKAVILVNLTPVGGLSVYWVTRGPMLAPSISTSILKCSNVSLIVAALPSTSPASALSCFWLSKSTPGYCQSGSLIVVSATWLSDGVRRCAEFLRLLSLGRCSSLS